MKAVVLCAGYATRLQPISNTTPKPLIKILGIPLLEYTLNILDQNGIDEVFINRYRFPDKFEDVKIPENVDVFFSTEKEMQGTAGAILSFEEYLRGEDFIVVNGDILFSLDIKVLMKKHKKKKSVATMVLGERDVKGVTPIFIDDFSNVVSIGGASKKIYREFMFSGIHVLSPGFFDIVKRIDPPSCIVKDFFIPYLKSGGYVNSYIMDSQKELWIDMGSLEKYLNGSIRFFNMLSLYELEGNYGNYESFITEYWLAKEEGERVVEAVEGIWFGESSYIDSDATIRPPVFIGVRSRIERGSVIGPNTIIGNDVVIGEDTQIRDAIIIDGARTDSRVRIEKSIIAKDFSYPI